jgi:hypothetical protein
MKGLSMGMSYSQKMKMPTPAENDLGFNPNVDRRFSLIESAAPVSSLYVSPHEVPSVSLHVDVTPGGFVASGGSVIGYAGVAGFAVAPSSTLNLYLDGANSWALTAAASWPSTSHVRLGVVTTSAAQVLSIVDGRISMMVSGTG